MNTLIGRLVPAATLGLAVLLAACGGGGGGDTPPAPPPPPPTSPPAAPALGLGYGMKQLQFSWSAPSGASFYRLFENPDGVSGFTQVGGDLAATSHFIDVAVHRHDWANARYLVEACNGLGCTASNEVNTSAGAALAAIGYFKASNTDRDDRFGQALALSGDGNTLAVGSQFESSAATGVNNARPGQGDNSALNAGAVYVFTRVNGAWVQQAYLKALNAEALDSFGAAVALSDDGNTLAVGASQEASGANGSFDTSSGVASSEQLDNSALAAGAVYMFTRSGGTWTQRAYVKASNSEFADGFGGSVALSGDGQTLAVGATGEDSAATGVNNTSPGQADNSQISPGAVYVFARSGDLWVQQAYVKTPNAGTRFRHSFGQVVALSVDGNMLAASAWGESSAATGVDGIQSDDCGQPNPVNCAFRSGAVYIFARTGSTWAQQAYVKASNTNADDFFGLALALSDDGSTLAVGARGEDSNATGVFDVAGGQGVVEQADNSAADAGAVYVYTRSGGTWTPQAYIKASNAESQDFFGDGVALSSDGNVLAVGAFDEDSAATGINGASPGQADNVMTNSGSVYVFIRSSGTWLQSAYVKAPDTLAFDFYGTGLVLSNDGNTLAVGANGEDSAATGINDTLIGLADFSKPSAGAVYLY